MKRDIYPAKLTALSKHLRHRGIKGSSQTRLWLYRSFYLQYKRIGPTLSDQLGEEQALEAHLEIRPTASDELITATRRGAQVYLNCGDILPAEEKSETPSRISDLRQTPSAPSLSGICRSDAKKAGKDAWEKIQQELGDKEVES